MLLGWCSKPDPDGPFGPGNRVGLHQFLDAVFPDDPGCTGCGTAAVETVSCPSCSGCKLLGSRWAMRGRSVTASGYRTGARVPQLLLAPREGRVPPGPSGSSPPDFATGNVYPLLGVH